MKTKIYSLFAILALSVTAWSQGVAINETGANPNSNAILDVQSTNKGLLFPRIELTSTINPAPLSAHVAGMNVYNTATINDVSPGVYYNDGEKWNLVDNVESLSESERIVVFINTANPNTATRFSTGDSWFNDDDCTLTPPSNSFEEQEDPTLANNVNAVYYGQAACGDEFTTWIYDGTTYIQRPTIFRNVTPFFIGNTNFDARGNKTAHISRLGRLSIGTKLNRGILTVAGNGPIRYIRNGNFSPNIITDYSAGSIESPSAVAANRIVFSLVPNVYNGSSYQQVGYIRWVSSGAQSATNSGSRLQFATREQDASSDGVRMTIDHNGRVRIGTGLPDYMLHVIGNGSFNEFIRIASSDGNEAGFLRTTDEPSVQNGVSIVSSRGGGKITFLTNNTDERMRITNTGSVGIGTTTPFGILDLAGAATVRYTRYSNTQANFIMRHARGTEAAPTAHGNGNIIAQFSIDGYNGTDFAGAGGIRWIAQDAWGASNAGSSQMHFINKADGQNSSTKMLLMPNGNLGIGDGIFAGAISNPISTTTGAFLTSAGVWTNASDRRLKSDIRPSTYGLKEVMKLQPVSYIMKSDGSPQVGLIAQDVAQIVPEVVQGVEGDMEKGETLGVSYGNLVPVLISAIQELQEQVELLQMRIQQMEKKD